MGPKEIRRITEQAKVPAELAGQRLDQAAAALFPAYSRSRLAAWIKDGSLTLDGAEARPRAMVLGGETLHLDAEATEQGGDAAEPMAFPVIFEDEHLIVVNKPPGLVVHPGAGHRAGTLVNGLLHYDSGLAALPRAGIVHRLDKDTSGLLVVARTLEAHTALVRAMRRREIKRTYWLVVEGTMTGGTTVRASLGRHPHARTRMAVREDGRAAVTHVRLLERFRGHTLVEAVLETGRTHQIRVHMQHLGHPIVGDRAYGFKGRLPPHAAEALMQRIRTFHRQALHARELALAHPVSGEAMCWTAPLPDDMARLVSALRDDAGTGEEAEKKAAGKREAGKAGKKEA
jgi:23S rRNA pseudouridine1911/1915/1917 synthase